MAYYGFMLIAKVRTGDIHVMVSKTLSKLRKIDITGKYTRSSREVLVIF